MVLAELVAVKRKLQTASKTDPAIIAAIYTVWHEIFAGVYFREFHGFSDDSRKLNPAKINSREKKIRENLLHLFRLLNFN